jgi:hypothetical protein
VPFLRQYFPFIRITFTLPKGDGIEIRYRESSTSLPFQPRLRDFGAERKVGPLAPPASKSYAPPAQQLRSRIFLTISVSRRFAGLLVRYDTTFSFKVYGPVAEVRKMPSYMYWCIYTHDVSNGTVLSFGRTRSTVILSNLSCIYLESSFLACSVLSHTLPWPLTSGTSIGIFDMTPSGPREERHQLKQECLSKLQFASVTLSTATIC